jgi:hypothetical protein
MKTLQTLSKVAVVLILSATAYSADLQKLLSDGQTAMIRGDIAAAKRSFELARKMDPKNPVVVGNLKQIALLEAKSGAPSTQEKQLSQIMIPQIQFNEASLSSALDFMKKKIGELSGGKLAVNFVVQPGVDQNARVTVNLTDIPASEALRYVGELANAKFEYQKYAILVRPAGGAAPGPTPGQ